MVSCGATLGQALADSSGTSLTATPADWPFVIDQTSTTDAVTSGVVHQAIAFNTIDGPLAANVLNVDLTNSNVQVGAVLAHNNVYSPDETVSSMAARTGAVAGINGDFFELGASGRPENAVVSNGVVLQSPLQGGYAVIGITADKHVTIGPETLSGTVTVTSATYIPPAPTTTGDIKPPSGNTSQNQTSGAPAGTNAAGTNQTGDATSSPPGGQQTSPSSGQQTSSFALVGINRPGAETGGNLGLITPNMGSLIYVKSATVAYLSPVSPTPNNTGYTVQRVQSGVKAIPHLTGQVALVAGAGAAAHWMTNHVTPGSTVTINTTLSPDSGIVQAVGAGYQLLKNGQWYNDPHALAASLVNQKNPLTAVGVTRDGQHLFMVVFDGREVGQSMGVTYHQMASYLQSLGAWNAAMLDGGGSTEMVARLPGNPTVSVVNFPSDGQERHVADGLFVYSTEAQPGPVSQIVVNRRLPIALLSGGSQPVSAYALDAEGNPAMAGLAWSVQPSTLGSVNSGKLVANQAGSGKVVVTSANGVTSSVPLTVVSQPASLFVTPMTALTPPGQKLPLSVSAWTAGGQPISVQPSSVMWQVTPAGLGTVSQNGVFQAASPASDGTFQSSKGTVTATVGHISTTIPVAVGYDSALLDGMTTPSAWLTSAQSAGKLSFDKTMRAVVSDRGSMKINYNYSAGSGVEQTVFWPKATMSIGANAAGEAPGALGFWVCGDASGLQFAVCLSDAAGRRQTVYPFKVNFSGWRFITLPLPSSMVAPITVHYLDFLVSNPKQALKGALHVSDLQALYAPASEAPASSLTTEGPSWLNQVQKPTQFQGNGPTIGFIAGTQVSVGSTGSAFNFGSSATQAAGSQALQQFAKAAKSGFGTSHNVNQQFGIQTVGDMVSHGTQTNLAALKTALTSTRLPVHVAVGAGEVTGPGGITPFIQTFGATHYAYTVGQAEVVVLDDANGGVTAADSRQSPHEAQYSWLVSTLLASRSKVVLVVANQSPYGATPGSGQSMTEPGDAMLLERLLSDLQRTRPTQHVMLITEGGYQSTVRSLNASGQDTANGVANLFVPSVMDGVSAHTNSAYALIHIDGQGRVQWTDVTVSGQTAPTSGNGLAGGQGSTSGNGSASGTGSTKGAGGGAGVVHPKA